MAQTISLKTRGKVILTLLLTFAALITIGLIGLEVGANQLLVGMVFAFLPAPVYISLALWLDRFEAEPTRLLVYAFVWGASGAVLISYVFNTVIAFVVAQSTGEENGMLFSIIISAPFFEELSKALALFVLYFWRKDEFDNIIDGIVYAAMVGLGFALVENFQYYGNAANEGGAILTETFLLRGILSPFAHPLFTAMTGIGLGWARQSTNKAVKVMGPLLGLGAAMTLHFLWNYSAVAGDAFLAVYIIIMIPVFISVIILIFFSLRREGSIIRSHLARELETGVLQQADYDCLDKAMRRMAKSWGALRGNGLAAWRARKQFHQIASELAFLRWREERDATGDESYAQLEAYYIQQLRDLQGKMGG